LPAQFGTQFGWHWPAGSHEKSFGQKPQLPPQPSAPHCLPPHAWTQFCAHHPFWQTWLTPHWPHSPPQPSGPHCFPLQLGWQPHDPQPKATTSAAHIASHANAQQSMSSMQTHSMTMGSSHMGSGLGTQQEAALAGRGTMTPADNATQADKTAKAFPITTSPLEQNPTATQRGYSPAKTRSRRLP